ncbi:hypothetical protein HPB50_029307 [Hyalomma asiaticum]|nr:hypothetical protein HPB50_029307 [Hyalomma asiaticum]
MIFKDQARLLNRSTGSGRLLGYRGRILQLRGISTFTDSRRLAYQTPPRRPVRRPRPPRADVLTAMAAQCSRTLDQGTNMLVVAGPLCIRKFRA